MHLAGGVRHTLSATTTTVVVALVLLLLVVAVPVNAMGWDTIKLNDGKSLKDVVVCCGGVEADAYAWQDTRSRPLRSGRGSLEMARRRLTTSTRLSGLASTTLVRVSDHICMFQS